jgi:ubiquinone/menaquinone biosynthesis C-methylase UbiE
MDYYQRLYQERADDYDALVSCEDYCGEAVKALRKTRPLADLDVVEFGAGTGRLTRSLASEAKSVAAFDASMAMLTVAGKRLACECSRHNWTLAVGDHRQLPQPDASADLAVAGWTFGHFTEWHPDTWREEIGKALAEMKRVLRPGGEAIIFETLGTGAATPTPPTRELADYYKMLEEDFGFSSDIIRTDYRFSTVDEAERLCRFFFGDKLADRVRAEKLVIVPEWTGVWRWSAPADSQQPENA